MNPRDRTAETTLRRQKEELLALLLAEEGFAASQARPLTRRERRGALPLSFAQQRLWFLDALEPDSSQYHIVKTVRLSGALDRAALQQALDAIVARHEALRTTFTATDGIPRQVIAAPRPVELPVIDLRGLPAAERLAEAQRRLAEEARRPFDLSQDLMLRVMLAQLDDDDHALLLTMHHIASDGWSMGILNRELGVLYDAFAAGRDAPLPELPIQYADFAVWQREWLQGDVLEAQLAYWKQQLEGAPAALNLPIDRPRPPIQTYRGARQVAELPRSLMEALRALSRQEGATLFMTLLAAFQTLLFRYAGQEDVVVGTPIANRNHTELEGLIGFFANTLALRGDLSGDPPFRELLGRAREMALGAYAHQDLPFEKLVAELQCERDMSRSPVFQVAFALQNTPASPLELAGLTVTRLEVESVAAKFDLLLSVTEGEGGLRASLEYNTDLFEEATITRMLGHFQTLLEGIVADPGQRLSALPLLAEAERHQLLVAWNDTAAAYPHDRCLHHLFEEQAERVPDALAVVFGEQQLTYRELNLRADRLAGALRRRGVGPEARVGLCVASTLEFVVGALAILKAGGAYVPLDPAYPAERLAWMLADAGAHVSVTQTHLQERLPAQAAVLCLDGEEPPGESGSAENRVTGATAAHLAYVIYTSGSTGEPKGVAVPHRAVARLVCQTDYVQITPSDRVAQASNHAFDAATFEVWGALLHGACLVGIRREILLSPERLAAVLRRQRISALFLTTALFNQIARLLPDAFRTVRHVLFGGEAADPLCVAQVLRHGPPERLLHVYGPTETTTFATWYRVESVPADAATVPIGRPIANTRLYVLDRARQPVPVGVPGELYIGGPGVAHGYLGRPEMTAERFLPDPFHDEGSGVRGQGSGVRGRGSGVGEVGTASPLPLSPDPRPLTPDPRPLTLAARLYRTGDRVRYRPDGNLEFLGRTDDQVKVRGFRVEPGEIEAVLARHPAVRAAIVTARKDAAGEQRLVAYVVATNDARCSMLDARRPTMDAQPPPVERPSEGSGGRSSVVGRRASSIEHRASLIPDLRRYLSEKLPEYMVPPSFMLLDALPVTPNGKVDRQALPAPDGAPPALSAEGSVPGDAVELRLVQIWEKLLGITGVGVTDDFFALGGHSLMAVRLRAQIEAAFGQSLPLAALFQTPTIAQLADVLRRKGGPVADSSLIPIRSEGSHPPFFCVYPTLGDVRRLCTLARYIGSEQPLYGLQIPNADGRPPARIRLKDAAAQFIAEIRAVQPLGPYLLGGICFGGLVAFEIARQLHAAGQKVSLLLLIDPGIPPGPSLSQRVGTPHTAGRVRRSRVARGDLLERAREGSKQRARAAKGWFSRHVREFAGLSGPERLAHGFNRMKHWTEWQIGMVIYRLYRICRPLLPHSCRAVVHDHLWPYTQFDSFVDAKRESVLPRYPGRLTFLRAQQQAARHDVEDFRSRWQELSTGALESHEIPGGHVTMFEEPQVQVMAETLMDCLRRARSEGAEANVE